MFNISYSEENSRKYPSCKIHGYCSEEILRNKLKEITLYGLSIFSKTSKECLK